MFPLKRAHVCYRFALDPPQVIMRLLEMAEFSAKAGKTRHARLTLDERFRLRSQSEVMVVGGKVGRGTKDEGRFGVYNKSY